MFISTIKPLSHISYHLTFSMSKFSFQITAPDGAKWTQLTGLLISNEFIVSSKGEFIETVDPAHVEQPLLNNNED